MEFNTTRIFSNITWRIYDNDAPTYISIAYTHMWK